MSAGDRNILSRNSKINLHFIASFVSKFISAPFCEPGAVKCVGSFWLELYTHSTFLPRAEKCVIVENC